MTSDQNQINVGGLIAACRVIEGLERAGDGHQTVAWVGEWTIQVGVLRAETAMALHSDGLGVEGETGLRRAASALPHGVVSGDRQ